MLVTFHSGQDSLPPHYKPRNYLSKMSLVLRLKTPTLGSEDIHAVSTLCCHGVEDPSWHFCPSQLRLSAQGVDMAKER